MLDSLKMDNPFQFTGMEKNVVSEAKTSAEYFDSIEKLDSEASRIVKMLKSAKYAIAFTGWHTVTSLRIFVYFYIELQNFKFRGACCTFQVKSRLFHYLLVYYCNTSKAK